MWDEPDDDERYGGEEPSDLLTMLGLGVLMGVLISAMVSAICTIAEMQP